MYNDSLLACPISRLLTAVVSLAQFFIHAAAQLIWSDEGHLLLNGMIFYPSIAALVLALAVRATPKQAVKRCKGYCIHMLARLRAWLSTTRRWLVPGNILVGMLQAYYL